MTAKRSTIELTGDGFSITACRGGVDCKHSALDAPDLPQRLFEALEGLGIGDALRQRVGTPLRAHHLIRVAISYCPNSCGRSQIADVGLIGADMPKVDTSCCSACGACSEVCRDNAILLDEDGTVIGVDRNRCLGCGDCAAACTGGCLSSGTQGFRLMLGGKLGRHPRFAEELTGLHTAANLPPIVARCVANYLQLARGHERMGDVVSRVGAARLASPDEA